MRIRRLFAGVAVGAVCVLVSAHSSIAGYVEVSIVETETAGRPGQTFRQEHEADKSQEEHFDRDRNRMRLMSRNGNRSWNKNRKERTH